LELLLFEAGEDEGIDGVGDPVGVFDLGRGMGFEGFEGPMIRAVFGGGGVGEQRRGGESEEDGGKEEEPFAASGKGPRIGATLKPFHDRHIV